MAFGITDLVATVSISKGEYEKLIRESETLHKVKNYVGNVQYVSDNTLKTLLNIEEKSKESEGTGNDNT